MAELQFGAEKSSLREQNHARIQRLMDAFRVLHVGLAVVRRYAAVRAAIESVGRPKSDFDLMIACTALEQNATLVTHDAALKDGAIAGLVVEDWL